jgi:hypothetical protein
MGQGRPRTAQQLKALLAEAGFKNPRQIATLRPMLTSLFAAEN